MIPAIVVTAYNRPRALERLLGSLQEASYPEGARPPLVISIDRGDDEPNRQVRELALGLSWPHGPKEVICHDEHLGIVPHVFFCGSLTEKHGAVIFLEDDLFVSPAFYRYAAQALAFHDSDRSVAGISLYALWFNGYTHHPFIPLADESDGFFLQIPYTQGQAWTRAQWQRFSEWRARGRLRPTPADNLHELWLRFAADDHFPIFTKYLVETGQFYAYPRISLATGSGDAGAHFVSPSPYFQVPLLWRRRGFSLKRLDESVAAYDSFFEILPDRLNRLSDAFQGLDYAVDLYATKSRRNLGAEYVLTSRQCRVAGRTFGRSMWPMEANVIAGVPGEELALARADDLRWDLWSELATRKDLHDYFARHRRMSRKLRLGFALVDVVRFLTRRRASRNKRLR